MEIAIVLVVAAVLVVAFILLKKKGPSETAAPRELHEAAPARPVAEPTREKAPRENAAPVEAEPVRRAPSARPPAGSPQPPPVAAPATPIAVEEEYEAPEEQQPSTAQVGYSHSRPVRWNAVGGRPRWATPQTATPLVMTAARKVSPLDRISSTTDTGTGP